MDWYEDEVRSLERSLRDRPPAPGALVFYGSSSVRLWEKLAADFEGLPVVNLGFGGSTLEACAHFFERLVPPARPRSVLLYAGDNDLGDGRAPEDVLAAYQELVRKRDRFLAGTPLAFLSIKPSPARWWIDARVRRANALVRQAAEGAAAATFLDVYPLMLGPDGAPRPELYAEDGLHLSPEGYRLWAGFLRGPAHTLFSS